MDPGSSHTCHFHEIKDMPRILWCPKRSLLWARGSLLPSDSVISCVTLLVASGEVVACSQGRVGRAQPWEDEVEMVCLGTWLNFPCGRRPNSARCVPPVSGHSSVRSETVTLLLPACRSPSAHPPQPSADASPPPTAATAPAPPPCSRVESLSSSILHTLRTYHASRRHFGGGQSCCRPLGSRKILSQPGVRRHIPVPLPFLSEVKRARAPRRS